eukprot:PhM_4_TR10613/c0_g1_i3/m.91309
MTKDAAAQITRSRVLMILDPYSPNVPHMQEDINWRPVVDHITLVCVGITPDIIYFPAGVPDIQRQRPSVYYEKQIDELDMIANLCQPGYYGHVGKRHGICESLPVAAGMGLSEGTNPTDCTLDSRCVPNTHVNPLRCEYHPCTMHCTKETCDKHSECQHDAQLGCGRRNCYATNNPTQYVRRD